MTKWDKNEALGYLLNSTTNALNTLIQRHLTLNGISIPFEQMKLLVYISLHPGVNQQTICDEMNKAKPGMSRLVDSLVKRGLVVQKQDTEDRRNKQLFATDEGIHVRDQFFPIGLNKIDVLETALGQRETQELKEHLKAIKAIILREIEEQK